MNASSTTSNTDAMANSSVKIANSMVSQHDHRLNSLNLKTCLIKLNLNRLVKTLMTL